MTFQPDMTNRIEGVRKLDALRWRAWNGVIADIWTVGCDSEANGDYYADHPRLFFMLEGTPGGRLLIDADAASDRQYVLDADRPMSYIPAGLPLSTRVDGLTKLKHLDLHLDMSTVEERLGARIDSAAIERPRLAVQDERLMALAHLMAAECESPDSGSDLYGDSLTTALIVALFNIGKPPAPQRYRLPPWQLRRVTDFIEENCLRTIKLQELATLAGLSEPYFCQAFKASTGARPHEWQMKSRIARVKVLLKERQAPLAAIAASAGFADQAHFTRVFRRMVGTTPAAWQREHCPYAS
ncbi:helix-turn-helix domain-containing protein [Shinella sp.]|uniref:helix-turn-helix domain-containing protein n=1 Tax=Shinella sp. TaxID=1870904 RepID=UPI003F72AEA5